MKNNILNLFLIFSIFSSITITTSYGMIQKEQLTLDLATVIKEADIAEVKDFDKKITEDIDRLIVLLQKSSQPILGNKIAAGCTAFGLGGIIGGLTGATCRLSQNKVKLDSTGQPIKICYHFNRDDRQNCNCGIFEIDMSDFLSSSALVGIPVGLVAAGLSLLILKKMIPPKNNSVLNTFIENLNHFKTALSKNEPLSQDDQIKLEKIISLTPAILEKNSSNFKATILKKLSLILTEGLAVGYVSGMLSEQFLSELLLKNTLTETNIRHIPQAQEDIFFYTQVFSFLLAGTGFAALITNKFFDSESANLELLQAAITKELHELLPNEITSIN